MLPSCVSVDLNGDLVVAGSLVHPADDSGHFRPLEPTALLGASYVPGT